MKVKRAALYVRVSTEDQRTDLQERQLIETSNGADGSFPRSTGTRSLELPHRVQALTSC